MYTFQSKVDIPEFTINTQGYQLRFAFQHRCNDFFVESIDNRYIYHNIEPGVDIVYSLDSDRVKENIVIWHKENAVDKLSFIVESNYATNLSPNQDGNLELRALSGNTLAIFDKPIIIDNENITIGKSNISYEKMNDYDYKIDIIFDKSKLLALSASRYPIVIDPPIIFANDQPVAMGGNIYGPSNTGADGDKFIIYAFQGNESQMDDSMPVNLWNGKQVVGTVPLYPQIASESQGHFDSFISGLGLDELDMYFTFITNKPTGGHDTGYAKLLFDITPPNQDALSSLNNEADYIGNVGSSSVYRGRWKVNRQSLPMYTDGLHTITPRFIFAEAGGEILAGVELLSPHFAATCGAELSVINFVVESFFVFLFATDSAQLRIHPIWSNEQATYSWLGVDGGDEWGTMLSASLWGMRVSTYVLEMIFSYDDDAVLALAADSLNLTGIIANFDRRGTASGDAETVLSAEDGFYDKTIKVGLYNPSDQVSTYDAYNRANFATLWPNTYTTATYGDSFDGWGTNWTSNDLENRMIALGVRADILRANGLTPNLRGEIDTSTAGLSLRFGDAIEAGATNVEQIEPDGTDATYPTIIPPGEQWAYTTSWTNINNVAEGVSGHASASSSNEDTPKDRPTTIIKTEHDILPSGLTDAYLSGLIVSMYRRVQNLPGWPPGTTSPLAQEGGPITGALASQRYASTLNPNPDPGGGSGISGQWYNLVDVLDSDDGESSISVNNLSGADTTVEAFGIRDFSAELAEIPDDAIITDITLHIDLRAQYSEVYATPQIWLDRVSMYNFPAGPSVVLADAIPAPGLIFYTNYSTLPPGTYDSMEVSGDPETDWNWPHGTLTGVDIKDPDFGFWVEFDIQKPSGTRPPDSLRSTWLYIPRIYIDVTYDIPLTGSGDPVAVVVDKYLKVGIDMSVTANSSSTGWSTDLARTTAPWIDPRGHIASYGSKFSNLSISEALTGPLNVLYGAELRLPSYSGDEDTAIQIGEISVTAFIYKEVTGTLDSVRTFTTDDNFDAEPNIENWTWDLLTWRGMFSGAETGSGEGDYIACISAYDGEFNSEYAIFEFDFPEEMYDDMVKITGFEIVVQRRAHIPDHNPEESYSQVYDRSIRLGYSTFNSADPKTSAVTWAPDNKADTENPWKFGESYKQEGEYYVNTDSDMPYGADEQATYGGPSDKWGAAWKINDLQPDTGVTEKRLYVAIQARLVRGRTSEALTALIDNVKLKIHATREAQA